MLENKVKIIMVLWIVLTILQLNEFLMYFDGSLNQALAANNSIPAKKAAKVLEMTRFTKAPSTSFIKANRAFMETRDFDGLVIFINYYKKGKKRSFTTGVFDYRYTIELKDVQPEIDNLRGAGFVKFTDNFLGIHCSNTGGLINWYGDEVYWNTILNNIEIAARVAKNAGLRGIMLDCENYLRQKAFHYPTLEKKYPGRTNTSGIETEKRAQWEGLVRLRGKQMMQRMIKGYGSNFRLIFRPGFQIVRQVFEVNQKKPLSKVGANDYELLPAFINGLLEGLSGNADIVEFSPAEFNFKNGIPSQGAFDRIWDILKSTNGYAVAHTEYVLPENISLYKSRYKMGFMVWFDDNQWPKHPSFNGTTWSNDSARLSDNTWTPSSLQVWLQRCKEPRYSAVYCTIWKGNYMSNLPNWWKSEGINEQYVDVLNKKFE